MRSVPLQEPVKLEPPPPRAPPITNFFQAVLVLSTPSGVPAWSGCFVTRLNLKGIIVVREVGVGSRTPFHFDGKSRRTRFATVSTAEIYRICAARQPAARHGPSYTCEEDFIVTGNWYGSDPRIASGVECCRGAASTR